MSTTFGVVVPSYYEGDEIEIEIARRVNSKVYWKNHLGPYLPDDMKVKALDNSPQGIYTIGDIKRYVNSITVKGDSGGITLTVRWEVLDRGEASTLYCDEDREYELYAFNPETKVEYLLDTPEDVDEFESTDLLLVKELK